jgi:predicted nucleotidyltransferase
MIRIFKKGEGGAEVNEIQLFLCYIWNMIRFRKIPVDIHEKIDSLIDLFQSDLNIVFSYLFGGLLKGRLNPLSDVDLCVYLRDPKKSDYLQLIGNISRVLSTEEIDLVILNQAPLSLAGRILQNRRVLNDRDPFLRHRYESLVLRKFFDFTLKERNILKGRYGIA